MMARHLYRLAHREADGTYAQVGRAYLSLDAACLGAITQNAARKEFSLPPLTHVAIYTMTAITDLAPPVRG